MQHVGRRPSPDLLCKRHAQDFSLSSSLSQIFYVFASDRYIDIYVYVDFSSFFLGGGGWGGEGRGAAHLN